MNEFKSIFTPRTQRKQSIIPIFSKAKINPATHPLETDDEKDEKLIIPSIRRKS